MFLLLLLIIPLIPSMIYGMDLSAQFAWWWTITITTPGTYTLAAWSYTIDSLIIAADNVSLIGEPATIIEVVGWWTGVNIAWRQSIRLEWINFYDSRAWATPFIWISSSRNIILSGIMMSSMTAPHALTIVWSSFISIINSQFIDYLDTAIFIQSREGINGPSSNNIIFDSLIINCNSSCTAIRLVPTNGWNITGIQFLWTTRILNARHGIVIDNGSLGSVTVNGVWWYWAPINGGLPALDLWTIDFETIEWYFLINGSRTTYLLATDVNFDGITDVDDIENQLAHGCTDNTHPFWFQGSCNNWFPLATVIAAYETPGQWGLSFDYLNHPSWPIWSINYTSVSTKTLTICVYRMHWSGGTITGTLGPIMWWWPLPIMMYPQTIKTVNDQGCMSFDGIPWSVTQAELLLTVWSWVTLSSQPSPWFPLNMTALTTLNQLVSLASHTTTVGLILSWSPSILSTPPSISWLSTPVISIPWWWGGWGGGLIQDHCPQWDTSSSYYDGRCSNTPLPLSMIQTGKISSWSSWSQHSLLDLMTNELSSLKQSRSTCHKRLPHFSDLIFTDTQGHPYATHIASLVARCAIWGQWPHKSPNMPNKFRPDDTVRLWEFIKILVNTIRNREGKESLTDFAPIPHTFVWYINIPRTHRSLPYLAEAAYRWLLKNREIQNKRWLSIDIDRPLTDRDIVWFIRLADPRIWSWSLPTQSWTVATRGYAVYLTTTLLGMTDDAALLANNSHNLRLWARLNTRLATMTPEQQTRFMMQIIELFTTTHPSQRRKFRIDNRALANKFSTILTIYNNQ